MPQEVIDSFSSLKPQSTIIDGTLGKGGHSKLLIEKGFKIIGIDRDKEAIEEAQRNLKGEITFVNDNFANIDKILAKLETKQVSGILLDLGVSTYQLENKERGFGFSGKLDMRMSSEGQTAADIVNSYSQEKLEKTFKIGGEKVYFKEIAENIIKQREKKKIEIGEELLEIITQSMPEQYRRTRKHHFASPTFRALRIEVNKDLENLSLFLDKFQSCLEKDGILSIITFHTIEERIVKNKFQELKGKKLVKILTKHGMPASKQEINKNPKAIHAKLWILRKK